MSDDLEVDKEKKQSSLIIFGRDVAKLPCFRNSYLYGIMGGFGAGLTYFLLTSKSRMATHVGFGSFMTITMVYWVQCRYTYSTTKFEMMRLQELLKQHATYEGTEVEKQLDRQYLDPVKIDDV